MSIVSNCNTPKQKTTTTFWSITLLHCNKNTTTKNAEATNNHIDYMIKKRETLLMAKR